LAQARHRQHRATQVRHAEQRGRRLRDVRECGDVHHFHDIRGGQRIELPVDAEGQEARGVAGNGRFHVGYAVCCCDSSASEAISSIAAARSSTPLDCSVAAVEASRAAMLACSAAAAIWRAAFVISTMLAITSSAPFNIVWLALLSAVMSFVIFCSEANTARLFSISASVAAITCSRSPFNALIWSRMPR